MGLLSIQEHQAEPLRDRIGDSLASEAPGSGYGCGGSRSGGPTKAVQASIDKAAATAKRYDSEKGDIKKEAEQFEAAAEANGKINDRCDHAALSLQIAVVICSVAILSRWKLFWYIGMGLGVAGALIGISAFRL